MLTCLLEKISKFSTPKRRQFSLEYKNKVETARGLRKEEEKKVKDRLKQIEQKHKQKEELLKHRQEELNELINARKELRSLRNEDLHHNLQNLNASFVKAP